MRLTIFLLILLLPISALAQGEVFQEFDIKENEPQSSTKELSKRYSFSSLSSGNPEDLKYRTPRKKKTSNRRYPYHRYGKVNASPSESETARAQLSKTPIIVKPRPN